MYIKQLSVFLENKPGTLQESLSILKQGNVNIVALSLADTNEFGLLRLIVDKPEEAKAALKKGGYTSMLNDVIAVRLQQRVGYLFELMDAVAKAGINVEYMYAASSDSDGADMIIKTSDLEGTVKALDPTRADVLEQKDLIK